jgi:hypothetical protein
MRRLGTTAALLLAFLLAVVPVVHNHSLNEKVATPCSVCAFGADRTHAAPVIAAPVLVAYSLTTSVVVAVVIRFERTASPRGPPAA